MEKDTIENRNSNNDNKAQRYAALSNWRWAQHHAEMEENNVQILNMLDGKKTYPLQETSKTNVLQHPLNTQKNATNRDIDIQKVSSPSHISLSPNTQALRRRRKASPISNQSENDNNIHNSKTTDINNKNEQNSNTSKNYLGSNNCDHFSSTKRVSLADIFPANTQQSQKCVPDNAGENKTTNSQNYPANNVKNENGKTAALRALRNQLMDEMGDQVWIEVKEQENGWNWEEPVVAITRDTFRASNALNEDIFDFAIILKNNLDDRTANAVREKRRLRKLNKQERKKDKHNGEKRDALTLAPNRIALSNHIEKNSCRNSNGVNFYDNNDDADEIGSSSSSNSDEYDNDISEQELAMQRNINGNQANISVKSNYMHKLQRQRRKNRQEARFKVEDDDYKIENTGNTTTEEKTGNLSINKNGNKFFAPVQLDGSKTLRAVVKRLRDAGLYVKRLKAADGKKTLLKVRAPQERLELEAERMHLIMRMRNGGWDRFRVSTRDKFCGAGYDGVLFRSSDRQSILHNIVKLPKQYNGAGLGPESPYAPSIEMMFPLHMNARLRGLRNSWVKFWNPKMPSRFLTTNNSDAFEDSNSTEYAYNYDKHNWVSRCMYKVWDLTFFGLLAQPLDAIAEYYGENVAFYFAWVQFYTKWLILPSIVGFGLFILQIRSGSIDHPLLPFYALFMAVWATFFLVFWRRRKHELAYRWGVLYHENAEVPRPEFHGEPRRSEITGEWEMYYPKWKRIMKQILSFPISGAWLGGILIGMVVLFNLRDNLIERLSGSNNDSISTMIPGNSNSSSPSSYIYVPSDIKITNKTDDQAKNNVKSDTITNSETNSGFLHFGYTSTSSDRMSLDVYDSRHYGDASFWVYLLLPPLAYGFMIPVLDALYKRLATQLNKWENHETESAYQNSLITKVVFFKLINAFCSLYYFAFSGRHPILRLTSQLASFMIAGQILNNTKEILVPCLKFHAKQYLSKRQLKEAVGKSSLSKRRIRQATSMAWEESRKPIYDTFADYAEMIVQFGYVTFFSMAFPLAPICALVNNLIEIRTDAYKLTYHTQRPVARKAGGIGVWFPILQVMSVFAVMTNLAIIGFTTGQLHYYFPDWSNTEKMFAVFVFEHIVLLIMFLIYFMVPHMPRWVEIAVAKDQFKAEGGIKVQDNKSINHKPVSTSNSILAETLNIDDDDDVDVDALDNSIMKNLDTSENFEDVFVRVEENLLAETHPKVKAIISEDEANLDSTKDVNIKIDKKEPVIKVGENGSEISHNNLTISEAVAEEENIINDVSNISDIEKDGNKES
jgi:hypothetical protein